MLIIFQLAFKSIFLKKHVCLQIHASDADEGVSSSLEYALYKSNNSVISELFGVTHDTGEVYVRKAATGHGMFVFKIVCILLLLESSFCN